MPGTENVSGTEQKIASADSSSLEPASSLQDIGNLGHLQKDAAFNREVNAALRLNAGFRAAMENLKALTWAYYTSAKQFMNLYPYNPDCEFERSILEMAFFVDVHLISVVSKRSIYGALAADNTAAYFVGEVS